ncbi:MAG TPA: alpha/beta fold hydrolase [Chloroflexota bacterium]
MATFVLVHGSNQGGWIWKPVALKLQAAGHLVYRPTLEGAGERAPGLRAETSLNTWGHELARLMFYEDLTDVILVATSSGGLPVARAAEEVPERIHRLVFIDALVPISGESVALILNRPPWDPTQVAQGFSPDEARERAFSGLEPKLRVWAAERYTRQPRRPQEEPVDLKRFWSLKWQVDVLRCTQSPRPPVEHQRRTAELLGGTYQEIDAGHYPMLTHVDEIAAYLLAMA